LRSVILEVPASKVHGLVDDFAQKLFKRQQDLERILLGQANRKHWEIAMSSVVKNIVLVHGAFTDGSSWSKVIPLLQELGYKAVAVQNPMTSLADEVAFTKRIIALHDGPVILVGHSWGGTVITQAGDDSKVAALVYVTAYAPEVGNPQTMQAAPSDGQKDRGRFAWTEKSSQQSLPKACWNTLQKDSQLKSGNLRLRYRARATVPCSTKS
jgi:pimeloyl-ACP methyl ester carboxylesterase